MSKGLLQGTDAQPYWFAIAPTMLRSQTLPEGERATQPINESHWCVALRPSRWKAFCRFQAASKRIKACPPTIGERFSPMISEHLRI